MTLGKHISFLPKLIIAVFFAVSVLDAVALPIPARLRSREFNVPSKLRPRVNFWKDIFYKYGQNDVVIHHRNYPQVVFRSLNFDVEARTLNKVAFERHKKKAVEGAISDIKRGMRNLLKYKTAQNALEHKIVQELKQLPAKERNLNTILKDDLVRSQTGIREKFLEALQRSGRYLPTIERIFRENGLPLELTRLPFIESSFNYKAYSSVGAAGIWQFMPRTAKLYMQVNSVVDERLDPVEASRAAAKYLQYAHSRLGSWPLAITSYNHGVYGVLSKVKKLGTTDITTIVENPRERLFGFASANFYPEFLAALEISENHNKFFPNVAIEPELQFDEIKLERNTSVRHVLNQLKVEEEELKRRNYALRPKVWTGHYNIPAGYKLKVPPRHGVRVASLRAPESREVATKPPATSSVYGGITYRVRRGDTLIRIAQKYGVSVSSIKSLNGLRSDAIRIGQYLKITKPSSGQASRPQSSTSSGVVSKSFKYVVKRGDSLGKIAKRYKTSVSAIKKRNRLQSNVIRVGQVLVLGGSALKQAVVAKPTLAKYKVRRGDSLWSIAKKFKVSVSSLKSVNRIRSNKLTIGEILLIPSR